MTTNRRWLQSVIKAASSETILLPWAAKRMPPQTADVIRLIPAQKSSDQVAAAA
jgi:hypothetical protein